MAERENDRVDRRTDCKFVVANGESRESRGVLSLFYH